MSDVKKGVMIVSESNQNLGLAKKVSSKKPTDSDAIDKVSELSKIDFIKTFCENSQKTFDVSQAMVTLYTEDLTEMIDKIPFVALEGEPDEFFDKGKIVLNLRSRDNNSKQVNLIFHDELFTSVCITGGGSVVDTPIDDPSSVIFKFRDGSCQHLGHKYTYSNLEKIIQALDKYIDGKITGEEFRKSVEEKKRKLNESRVSLGLSKKVSSRCGHDESREIEDLALIDDLDTIVDLLIASYKKISTVKTTITTPSMVDPEVREVWFKNDSWDSVFTVVVKISNHFYTTQTKATPQIYIRQEARHDVCAWLEKNIPQEYQLNKNSFEWAVLSREAPVYSNAEERNGLPFFIIEKFAEAINDYFTPSKVIESNLGIAKRTRDQARDIDAIDNVGIIPFEDPEIARVCHEHGVYTYDDAAKVMYINGWFAESSSIVQYQKYKYKKFNEFKYFTGLKTIGECAFWHCEMLEEIVIPKNVIRLEFGAFNGCVSLKHLHLPEKLRKIDMYSLNCENLETVNIPDSVETISSWAFTSKNLTVYISKDHKMYYDTVLANYKKMDPSEEPLYESSLGLAKKVSEEDKDREAIDTVATLVDLGLPSGNLWSTVNVGSSCTEEPGDFLTFDDAIQAAKDYGKMHVPTKKDFEELRSRCEQKTVTFNGIKGIEFTGSNRNKLFFPYFGYQSSDEINHGFQKECDFWTSTIDPRYPGNAYGFEAGKFRNIDCSSQTSCHNKKFRFQVRLVKPVEDINEADLSIAKKSKNKVNESNLGLAKKSREKAETKTEEETIQEFGEISPDQFMKCLYDYAEKDLKTPRDKLTMTSVEDDSFEYVEFSIELRNDKGLDFLAAKRAKPYGKDGHGNEDLVGWFGIMRYDFIEGTSSPLTLAFSYKSPEWCNADGAMANYPTVYPCKIEVLQLAKELIKKRL